MNMSKSPQMCYGAVQILRNFESSNLMKEERGRKIKKGKIKIIKEMLFML